MDYAMPRARNVPNLIVVHQETPSPLNPLGVKGAGEAGTSPVTATLCNAIEDALQPLGIGIAEAPLTPERVWELINRRPAAQAEGSARRLEKVGA
jgi:carbon-monoxide dehydrogenase large subunit